MPLFPKNEQYTGVLETLNDRDILSEISLRKGEKSFTINKTKIFICLKDKKDEYYNNNMLMYVLLHEISHQYQYKKYGKYFVLKSYLDHNLYMDFWKAEVVADRLAIIKTLQILRKNNKDSNIKLVSVYNTDDKKDQIKFYLDNLHKEIKKLDIKTIDEINKYLIQKSKKDVPQL